MLVRYFRDFIRDRRGNIAILSTVMITSLVGVSGLVAEFGNGLLNRMQDQRIADAAALGGGTVYSSTASTTAMTAAVNNIATLNGIPTSAISAQVAQRVLRRVTAIQAVQVLGVDERAARAFASPVVAKQPADQCVILRGAPIRRAWLHHGAERQRQWRNYGWWHRHRCGAMRGYVQHVGVGPLWRYHYLEAGDVRHHDKPALQRHPGAVGRDVVDQQGRFDRSPSRATPISQARCRG